MKISNHEIWRECPTCWTRKDGERNYIVTDVESLLKIVLVKINRYVKNWKTHTD